MLRDEPSDKLPAIRAGVRSDGTTCRLVICPRIRSASNLRQTVPVPIGVIGQIRRNLHINPIFSEQAPTATPAIPGFADPRRRLHFRI
jgi:hypothetical protein